MMYTTAKSATVVYASNTASSLRAFARHGRQLKEPTARERQRERQRKEVRNVRIKRWGGGHAIEEQKQQHSGAVQQRTCDDEGATVVDQAGKWKQRKRRLHVRVSVRMHTDVGQVIANLGHGSSGAPPSRVITSVKHARHQGSEENVRTDRDPSRDLSNLEMDTVDRAVFTSSTYADLPSHPYTSHARTHTHIHTHTRR